MKIKLDSTNFIIWKNQFQNILRATGFLCYIDGTKHCPIATTANQGESETVSTYRDQWLLTDLHLYSCITETLCPSIFSIILQCKASHEVWSTLERRFMHLARSHIHQLKNRLDTISKKSESMEECLQ